MARTWFLQRGKGEERTFETCVRLRESVTSGTFLEWHFHQPTTHLKKVLCTANPLSFFSFAMAHSLQSAPVLLDDGQRVRDLRVPQLVSALTDLGVPTDTFPKLRAHRVVLLTSTLSKSRAAIGLFGALEDGRTINGLSIDDVRAELVARGGDPAHQGCQRSELQRIVRVFTNVPAFTFGAPVPAPAPPQTLPADGGAGGSRSSCGRATACHSSGCHSSVCHSSGCHPSACHYRGARRSCGTDQRSVGCASSFHATRSALDIHCRALALEPSGLGAPVQLLRPAPENRSQLPPRGLPFNWHGFR